MADSNTELVTFFKALADSNRLKIVGLLAEKSYSVEELAALLQLKPPTVSHHLAKLSEAGLVQSRAESYYSVYQLDKKVLDEKSRSIFSQESRRGNESLLILRRAWRRNQSGLTRAAWIAGASSS